MANREPRPSHPNISGAVRDVLIHSLDKGQAPIVLIVLLLLVVVWRLEPEALAEISNQFLNFLAGGQLIAWALLPLLLLAWWGHTKFLDSKYKAENLIKN